MKKVLLINDYGSGGGSEVVFNATYNLLCNEFEVQKFVGSNNKIIPKSPFAYIFSFKFLKLLTEKLKEFKPDIIHLKNYYHLLSPSILVAIRIYKRKNPLVKVIYTAHDYHLLCPNSGFSYYDKNGLHNFKSPPSISQFIFKKLDYRTHLHSLLKKTQWILAYKILKLNSVFDAFISPSEFLKELLEIKFPNKKVYLIRNPIEIKEQFIKNELDSSILKFIFAGRISHEKGLIQFLNALKEIHFNYQFDIYGEGELVNEVQNFIDVNKLNHKIKLMGVRTHTEILLLYKNYHAFVLPSIWFENAPLSILEAGISGLSILTSNHGGCKEMAEIFENSYLFDVFNKESIIKTIMIFIPELKSKIKDDIDVNKKMVSFSKNEYFLKIKNIYE